MIRVLRSGWLTTGPETQAFESEWSEYLGSSHSLAVNSATAGLHLALLALGIQPGDRVAVPVYTFTATVEILRYIGAQPVFFDCAPDSFQMDTSAVGEILENKPGFLKAAIPVHFGGAGCDPLFWQNAKEKYGLLVVEDCAHAFPVKTSGKYLGTFGDAGVFSFYANKTITTGEGGMVVTQDPALAQKIRTLRLHGIDRDAFRRYQSETPAWRYDVVAAGYKYNLTDIAASIGRVQLKKAQTLYEQRCEAVKTYLRYSDTFEDISMPQWSEENAWHLFPILVKDAKLRDPIIMKLAEKKVGTSVHYIPLHRMTYWAESEGLVPEDFPRAELLGISEISLPLYPDLGSSGAEKVIKRLKEILETIHG